MIVLEDVYCRYEPEGIEALRGVSLQIREGERLALIGPNGCGKTTLIRHCNALLVPEKGHVTVGGLRTDHQEEQNDIRSRVGMVFQNPDHQIVGMTVEDDVAFGPENLRLPAAEIRQGLPNPQRVGISDLRRNIEDLPARKRLVAMPRPGHEAALYCSG